MLSYYFTYKGRLTRKEFWLNIQLPVLLSSIALYVVFYAAGLMLLPPVIDAQTGQAHMFTSRLAGTVYYVLVFLFFIVGLFGCIRRYHDRDKSGWWYLIILVPFIGPLWLFIETGFLKGTEGPNRFDA